MMYRSVFVNVFAEHGRLSSTTSLMVQSQTRLARPPRQRLHRDPFSATTPRSIVSMSGKSWPDGRWCTSASDGSNVRRSSRRDIFHQADRRDGCFYLLVGHGFRVCVCRPACRAVWYVPVEKRRAVAEPLELLSITLCLFTNKIAVLFYSFFFSLSNVLIILPRENLRLRSRKTIGDIYRKSC